MNAIFTELSAGKFVVIGIDANGPYFLGSHSTEEDAESSAKGLRFAAKRHEIASFVQVLKP